MEQILNFFADVLLALGAFGAAVYCFVLSRRLSRLSSLDKGLGGAIAVLSAQVDEMNAAMTATKIGSEKAAKRLDTLNAEANRLVGDLDVMLAACHDLPDYGAQDLPNLRAGPSVEAVPEPATIGNAADMAADVSSGGQDPVSIRVHDERPPSGSDGAIPLFRHRALRAGEG